jgi:hypothetical protein
MQLKVFRLKDGKLELTGTREVRLGDAIIEGGTSMTEVRPGVIALKEKSTSDFPLLFGTESVKPTLPTQAELANARLAIQADKKKELAKSYKAAHPGATDKEVAAFTQGREPDPPCDSLDASIRKANPNWTDAQIDAFKRGR